MSTRIESMQGLVSTKPGRHLNAAILVGGASRRMGSPKAGLVFQGRRLLDAAVYLVAPFVKKVALVGRLPDGVSIDSCNGVSSIAVTHISDDPTTMGPLAGIAGAISQDPGADWLCLSCDMPGLTRNAIDWLLEQHETLNTATIGRLPGRDAPEPFPAIYGSSAIEAVRSFIRTGGTSLRGALSAMDARVCSVPPRLIHSWQNVNTPLEWDRFLRLDYQSSADQTQIPIEN